MKLQTDLREFVALLNSHDVKFVVVGGHAVAFHGYPRFTGDLDLLFETGRKNVARLLLCLESFGFASVGLREEDFALPERVIQLGYPPNRLDLLTSISGVTFEDVWEGKVAGNLDGLDVWFVGFEQLLQNKRSTGRTKDLADIEELDARTKR